MTNSRKRFLALACVIALQMMYIPTNRALTGGYLFKTPLDAFIPVVPAWVVPYDMWLPFWMCCYFWAAWKMEDRLYRAFIVASLLTISIAMSCFILFPTYIERPQLVGNDWATQLLRFTYSNDGVYNAFPSGHVYITTLIMLFFSRWYPRQRPYWVSILVIISLATLFTGQHYLPDPIGGFVLAWAAYRIGLWTVERVYPLQPARRSSRRRTANSRVGNAN